jgi:N-acetylglucosamine repressor
MKITKKDLAVLKAIHFLETPTRNNISRHANLSTVLISSILSNLEDSDWIYKTGKTTTTGGRPSAIYQFHKDFGCFVGISVKTESFLIIALEAAGKLIQQQEFFLTLSANPSDHIDNIITQLSFELQRFLKQLDTKSSPLAIGISVPGMVDTDAGIWRHGLQVTGIVGVNLKELIEKQFDLPVYVEDQSRATTNFELKNRTDIDKNSFALIYLGTGIGAGIVSNGDLFRGHNGLSAEIGHLIIDKGGIRCSCGNIGCLETIVSVPAIVRTFEERLKEGVISSLQKYKQDDRYLLSIENIQTAADEGDRLTQSTLFDIGLHLGDGCAKTIKFFCPKTLIISGPASVLGDHFRKAIDLVLSRQVMKEMLQGFRYEFAEYQKHHEAQGAAFVAMDFFWQKSGLEKSLKSNTD